LSLAKKRGIFAIASALPSRVEQYRLLKDKITMSIVLLYRQSLAFKVIKLEHYFISFSS
jgi:hypothetical protein